MPRMVSRFAHHRPEAAGAVAGHGDVVLLVGRGRGRVDGGRVRELLVLAHQRGGGDLGDHQARVEAGLGSEEGGQPEGEGRVDEERDAALGDGADLADGERQDVGGEGHRLGVEVAAGDDLVVGEDERVVGDRVRLGDEGGGGLAQEVEGGAVDLRLAADAVGILHAAVAFEVAQRGSPSLRGGGQARRRRRSGRGGRGACGSPGGRAPRSPWRRRSRARR